MNDCDLLVTHALLVDPVDGVREDAAVAVRGNRLCDVGDTDDRTAQFRAPRTIDATDKILLPGLVNAHTHASATLFRGYASDVSGKAWTGSHLRI